METPKHNNPKIEKYLIDTYGLDPQVSNWNALFNYLVKNEEEKIRIRTFTN